jgi:hypothetical protein
MELPNYQMRSINLLPESLPIRRNVSDSHDARREWFA